jgi:hypothetical protein
VPAPTRPHRPGWCGRTALGGRAPRHAARRRPRHQAGRLFDGQGHLYLGLAVGLLRARRYSHGDAGCATPYSMPRATRMVNGPAGIGSRTSLPWKNTRPCASHLRSTPSGKKPVPPAVPHRPAAHLCRAPATRRARPGAAARRRVRRLPRRSAVRRPTSPRSSAIESSGAPSRRCRLRTIGRGIGEASVAVRVGIRSVV